jgi:iron complex outermembrane receptor protein
MDYRASLDYRWTERFMTYATYSTGYKAGGVSPRFFFASHIIPFGPEELKAYEIGFKTDLLDNTLRVNGAYFINNYTNQQAGAPGGVCPTLTPVAPCFATFNNTDTRYKGAELEVTYRPTADLLIDFSGSQIDSEYTRISPILLANPNFISNPKGPTGIPQYKLSAGVQQTFHFANESSLTPRLDVNYEAERQSNDIRTLPVAPAYTVMNARLTFRTGDGNWESAVAVMNLTDKYYYYNISDSVTAGWANAQPAPPRTWALTIRRSFN